MRQARCKEFVERVIAGGVHEMIVNTEPGWRRVAATLQVAPSRWGREARLVAPAPLLQVCQTNHLSNASFAAPSFRAARRAKIARGYSIASETAVSFSLSWSPDRQEIV